MGIVWEEYEDMRDGCCYLVVADVVPNSPSDEMQLRVGSVLQTMNGTPVAHMPFEELPHWLSRCRPLQLGFSAPVEEAGDATTPSDEDARSHRMLSPRRQSRGAPQPGSPGRSRNAFSARAWAPCENVLSRGHPNSNVGLDSVAATRACSAVAASMGGVGALTSSVVCGSSSGAAAEVEAAWAVQHVPRPPAARRPQ
jgi:hypothetical protein